ncbi:hypothetical protein LCGC14_1187280 [marine sediment metagenome]|uniref:Acylneuraminate cytidylyltransferase n=1 Tax=marine sediment metagenome TaxID=412755 RepID=A0A0F9PQW6_9ZZZZ
MKNILIISQARMASSRLPGKVLRNVFGKPLLWYLMERLKLVKKVNRILIATGSPETNQPIIDFAKEQNIDYFIGNEDDVLDRYYQAAKHYKGNIIVRITSDCPLMDPDLIDQGLEMFLNGNYAYISNGHPPTYPDGFDIEIFSFKALETAWMEAKLPSEREHVTAYIWNHEEKFSIGNFENEINLSKYRLTIDTPEDFTLISIIIKYFHDKWIEFRLKDVMKFLNENPKLVELNAMYIYNESYLKSLEEDKKFLEENSK